MTPGVRDSVAVHAAPLLVFGGGALLGLMTGRGRLLLGLMVLALTTAALINFGTRTTFYAAALLLPLNLGVIAWFGETRALSRRGASWLGLILLQAGLLKEPDEAGLEQDERRGWGSSCSRPASSGSFKSCIQPRSMPRSSSRSSPSAAARGPLSHSSPSSRSP